MWRQLGEFEVANYSAILSRTSDRGYKAEFFVDGRLVDVHIWKYHQKAREALNKACKNGWRHFDTHDYPKEVGAKLEVKITEPAMWFWKVD